MAGKAGRPSKDTPEMRETVLRALDRKLSLDSAAYIAGVSPSSLKRYRDADPDFDASCAMRIAEAEAKATDVVWADIEGNTRTSVATAQWWLERRTRAYRKDANVDTHSTGQAAEPRSFRWADYEDRGQASD